MQRLFNGHHLEFEFISDVSRSHVSGIGLGGEKELNQGARARDRATDSITTLHVQAEDGTRRKSWEVISAGDWS